MKIIEQNLESILLTLLAVVIFSYAAWLILDDLTGRGYERQVQLGLQYSTQAEREGKP